MGGCGGMQATRSDARVAAGRLRTIPAIVAACLSGLSPAARAELPQGGRVAAGSATIANTAPNQQRITQASERAIINWQSFSIGAADSVQFVQPSTASVTLNRVTGRDPSAILGGLSANGQIFLVNPYGIYFGRGASLDVGGLVASTLNIRDSDFLSGKYVFSRDAASPARAEVINDGIIKARDGGYVVLAGDYAANRGTLEARLGTVLLGAASKVTLDIVGDSLVSYALNERTVADLAGVANAGQLLADGGRVVMTASTARNLANTAVNNSGLIQAQSVARRDGAVYLMADGGTTQSSGTIDASGRQAGTKGGEVRLLGERVILADAARVDVSGNAGGGLALIGGNFHGAGPERNAASVFVSHEASVSADAVSSGEGGKVAVWSDGRTDFLGKVSARGGASSGDGGFVEVSSKSLLNFAGAVDTRAPNGKTGTLLLDPADITITNANLDITAATPFRDLTDNGGASTLDVATLTGALATTDVVVTTATATAGATTGNITVSSAINWISPQQLSLVADNGIAVNAAITGTNPASTLSLSAGGGATQTAAGIITVPNLELLGAGTFSLATAANSVGTLAASVSGSLNFRNSGALVIGSAGGTSGVNTGSGNFTLNVAGALTQAAGANLTSNIFQLTNTLAGAPTTLINASNNARSIAADVKGDFLYHNAGDLNTVTSGGVIGINTNNQGNIAIDVPAGAFVLGDGVTNGPLNAGAAGWINLSGNNIGQHSSSGVFADKLAVQTTGFVGLRAGDTVDGINTLAISATGTGDSRGLAFDIGNNKALTVGSVTTKTAATGSTITTTGVTTTGSNVLLLANGTVTVNNNIDVGSGSIGLWAGAGAGVINNAAINANGLSLKAVSDPGIQPASVKLLSALIAGGDYSYTAPKDLTVGSLFGLDGVSVPFGNLSIQTGAFDAKVIASKTIPAFDPVRPPSDYLFGDGTNRSMAGLILDQGISAGYSGSTLVSGGRSISLNSASGVFQWASDPTATPATRAQSRILADSLVVRGQGSFDLSTADNKINHLAANVNGNFTFISGTPFHVDHVVKSFSGVSVDVAGITTTANTLVSGSVAGGDDQYNQHNVTLSAANGAAGAALTIDNDITTDAKGSAFINIAGGGDANASVTTTGGVRLRTANLILVGDNAKVNFDVKSVASSLSAAGGRSMVIDNTDYTGTLTVLGLGALQGSGSKPVGDVYLKTGGSIFSIGGNSAGKYLLIRSTGFNLAGTMTMKDGAQVILQPLDATQSIGVNSFGLGLAINYERLLLQSFTQNATFYVGATPTGLLNDASVPASVKSGYSYSGNIFIGYSGGLALGFRSISAQTTGTIFAKNVGQVYNLRLYAPNVDLYQFEASGDQVHLISDNLRLLSANNSFYLTPNHPAAAVLPRAQIVLRPYSNNKNIYIGDKNPVDSGAVQYSYDLLDKTPANADIIVGGTTDQQLTRDIFVAYNSNYHNLGSRSLTLSTKEFVRTPLGSLGTRSGQVTRETWNAAPSTYPLFTRVEVYNGVGTGIPEYASPSPAIGGLTAGTSGMLGGTWGGCPNIAYCKANGAPNSNTTFTGTGGGTSGTGGTPCTDPSCGGPGADPLPPAPPDGDPTNGAIYNSQNTNSNGGGSGAGDTSSTGSSGSGDVAVADGDPGAGMDDGGPSGPSTLADGGGAGAGGGDDSGLAGTASGSGGGSSAGGDESGTTLAGAGSAGGSAGSDSGEGAGSTSSGGGSSAGGDESGTTLAGAGSAGGSSGASDSGEGAGAAGSGGASGGEDSGTTVAGAGSAGGSSGARDSGESQAGSATAGTAAGTDSGEGGQAARASGGTLAAAEAAGGGGSGSAGSGPGGPAGATASVNAGTLCLGNMAAGQGQDQTERSTSLANRPLIEVRFGGVNMQSDCAKAPLLSSNAAAR